MFSAILENAFPSSKWCTFVFFYYFCGSILKFCFILYSRVYLEWWRAIAPPPSLPSVMFQNHLLNNPNLFFIDLKWYFFHILNAQIQLGLFLDSIFCLMICLPTPTPISEYFKYCDFLLVLITPVHCWALFLTDSCVVAVTDSLYYKEICVCADFILELH